LRGALFVAATFDLDQRDRLILVNAKGERDTGETMAALAADYEVGEAAIFRPLQGPFEQAA